MDINQLKSKTNSDQDHMQMMHMGKLPDFSGAYTPDCTNVAAIQHFLESQNPHAINFPSNCISFSCGTTPTEQPLTDEAFMCSSNNNTSSGGSYESSQKNCSMAAMREMVFRIAAIQPIHVDPESIKPPKRRNVKISKDPQSIAARHRRERISQRIRILQRLVPGGTKMDTASMLDEAIHYVKFLKSQVQSLERVAAVRPAGLGFPVAMSSGSYFPMGKAYQSQNVHHFYGDA